MKYKIIDFPTIKDARGNLAVVEKNTLPFDFKRVYYFADGVCLVVPAVGLPGALLTSWPGHHNCYLSLGETFSIVNRTSLC